MLGCCREWDRWQMLGSRWQMLGSSVPMLKCAFHEYFRAGHETSESLDAVTTGTWQAISLSPKALWPKGRFLKDKVSMRYRLTLIHRWVTGPCTSGSDRTCACDLFDLKHTPPKHPYQSNHLIHACTGLIFASRYYGRRMNFKWWFYSETAHTDTQENIRVPFSPRLEWPCLLASKRVSSEVRLPLAKWGHFNFARGSHT